MKAYENWSLVSSLFRDVTFMTFSLNWWFSAKIMQLLGFSVWKLRLDNQKIFGYWHYSRSVWSRVYETVWRPSVFSLSVCAIIRAPLQRVTQTNLIVAWFSFAARRSAANASSVTLIADVGSSTQTCACHMPEYTHSCQTQPSQESSLWSYCSRQTYRWRRKMWNIHTLCKYVVSLLFFV